MNERLPVLFDRALRPEWLDFALAAYADSRSEPELLRTLQAHLRPVAGGRVTLEKTARQLQRMVGYRSPVPRDRLVAWLAELRDQAPEERQALRLRILVESNRFVADCIGAIDRLVGLGHDHVTLRQLTERMADRYGHRGMIPRRVRYVLQTLQAFGALDHVGRQWRTGAGWRR